MRLPTAELKRIEYLKVLAIELGELGRNRLLKKTPGDTDQQVLNN